MIDVKEVTELKLSPLADALEACPLNDKGHEWRLFSREKSAHYLDSDHADYVAPAADSSPSFLFEEEQQEKPKNRWQTATDYFASTATQYQTVVDEIWYCVHCTLEVERKITQ